MTAVDPAAGFDFLVGARIAEEQGFADLVRQRQAQDAQGFTDLVNQRLAADAQQKADDAAGFQKEIDKTLAVNRKAAAQATDPAKSAADQSARGILNTFLAQYGLTALADQVWAWYLDGRSIDQIMLDVRGTAEYKARFPAMDTLGKKGRALSEGEYISLERQYAQLGRQYGLPGGFYDQPGDFTSLIAGEVSPQEYSSRLQDYQALVFDTDPTARQQLQRLYGITAGDIAAYFIDPEKALPFLQTRFGAAQTAAASSRSGFGALSQSEAELLAGLDPSQAAQGFGNLVNLSEVAGQLPGEQEMGIDRQSLLDAQFRGNADAQKRIQRRAAQRAAATQGGGGFAQSQQGMAGIGSA